MPPRSLYDHQQNKRQIMSTPEISTIYQDIKKRKIMSTEAEINQVISEELTVPVEPDLRSKFSSSFLEFIPLMNEFCGHCRYHRPRPHRCSPSVPGCLLTAVTGCPEGKDLENILKRILSFSKP